MYRSFFKLERDPFVISPDPYFLYPTSQHQEAVAGLYYGVKARKGFMVLTGEVGTGKTLVVRCFLEMLDQKRAAYAYVFNSRLSSRQFLQYVAEDLGVPHKPTSKSDLLIQSSRHLIDRHRQGLTTVLVVDEAQHLTKGALEEIRLLTNLETPQGKLLQIILVGQPELHTKLESWDLRQLKQRITLRFRLQPLSELDTQGYVKCRLELAGDKTNVIFPEETLQRIFHYSQGTPRLVNILCDNALLSAYSLGQPFVPPGLVEEAARDLCLQQPARNGHRAVWSDATAAERTRQRRKRATAQQTQEARQTQDTQETRETPPTQAIEVTPMEQLDEFGFPGSSITSVPSEGI